jgi:hypothetical protein
MAKAKKTEAARRGYARGDSDAMGRLLAALALDDEAARLRALEELSRQRQELAQRFVEETLRRARERREALVHAMVLEDTGPRKRAAG